VADVLRRVRGTLRAAVCQLLWRVSSCATSKSLTFVEISRRRGRRYAVAFQADSRDQDVVDLVLLAVLGSVGPGVTLRGDVFGRPWMLYPTNLRSCVWFFTGLDR